MVGRQHHQEPLEHHAANELANFIATETFMQRAACDQKIAEFRQAQAALVGDKVPQKNASALNHVVIGLALCEPRPPRDRVGNFKMEQLHEHVS